MFWIFISRKYLFQENTFITNNIKGIQNNSKRLSVVEYFKNKLGNSVILLLQETHSTFNDENIWKNDFNVPVFYSHGVC